jgi:hypothetical protein
LGDIALPAASPPSVDAASVFGLYLDTGRAFDSVECANEALVMDGPMLVIYWDVGVA